MSVLREQAKISENTTARCVDLGSGTKKTVMSKKKVMVVRNLKDWTNLPSQINDSPKKKSFQKFQKDRDDLADIQVPDTQFKSLHDGGQFLSFISGE